MIQNAFKMIQDFKMIQLIENNFKIIQIAF